MQTPSHSHAPSRAAADAAPRKLARPFALAALASLLLLAASLEARAQRGSLGTQPRTAGVRADDDDGLPTSWGREEMLKRAELKRMEMAYKENLERAKEGAALGAELRQAYERSKSVGPAEQKKLGRLEKLARAIRDQAGGDDDKEGLRDIPADHAASFVQLQKLSAELNSKVEKTPRHVVSTSVINTANRLLGLIRHLRSSFK